MKKPRLIVNCSEAIANIDRYELELAREPELQAVMSYARAWHGYPTAEGAWRVAPSKFAGYADNGGVTYSRQHLERDGRRTERALAEWSEKVEMGSAVYDDMMAAVLHLFARYGRTPNKLIRMSLLKPDRPSGAALVGTGIGAAGERSRITVDPGVCGGRPTIRGMRVRVSDVLAMLAAGVTRADILADYPYLEDQDISAALDYAAETAGHRVIRAA